MVSSALGRLRSADPLRWLPMGVLLAAMAALFAFGGDRAYFYRSGNHNYNSAKTMAIAENLSFEHRFRLFSRAIPYADGDGALYKFYSRFPIGGYALVKLVALPFGDDLTAKILAGRALALIMFAGAALAAYLAIARVASDRWIAIAATLLAFSGYYALYYSDGIFNEGVMDLFGLALVFHGMVIFAQERRFGQLLAKSLAAVLLGWHVYAILMPFIALGFGGEALARLRPFIARSQDSQSGDGKPASVRAALAALLRSRYLALAAASIAFGVALLGFNLINEYTAFRGERAPSEGNTAQSILRRFGQDAEFNERWADELAWGAFIPRQFMRAGGMATPYALAEWTGGVFNFPEPREVPLAAAAFGFLVVAGALVGIARVRAGGALPASIRQCRLPLAAATLAGFCWALPLRYNTYDRTQDFESLFYLGAPLTLFALALAFAKARLGERFGARLAAASLWGASAIAATLFAASAIQMGRLEADDSNAAFQRAMIAEFQDMRDTVRGKTVTLSSDIERWADGSRYFAVYYYLSGAFLEYDIVLYQSDFPRKPTRAADFVASRYRDGDFGLLTPDNRIAFLYEETDLDDLYRANIRRLESAEPLSRSAFDVHLDGKTLTYLKRPCAPQDAAPRFFLHAFPANPEDLPAAHRDGGFYGQNFVFADRGKTVDGACVLMADLPRFPAASFATGQYVSNEGEIWSVFAKPPPDAETLAIYENAYAAISSSQPAARSDWDVYADGKTLSYLKSPCAEEDTRGRFLLSVYPKNARDLPEDRREAGHGHDSLNFDFARWGTIFNGKCMVRRALPDYGVASVEVGQWIPGGETLWRAEFEVGD